MSEHECKPVEKRGLEGVEIKAQSTEDRLKAIDQAFDYRGDVTIRTTEGKAVEGYVYDRRLDVADPYIRLIPKDGSPRIRVPIAAIGEIAFTGRDTASGRSWETWLAKYREKKAKGEAANIEAEELE